MNLQRLSAVSVLLLSLLVPVHGSGVSEVFSADPDPSMSNAVSVYTVSMLFGTLAVSYERKFSSLFSLEITPFYHSPVYGYPPGTSSFGTFFEWYGVQAGVLVFPGRKVTDGLFLSGGLTASRLSIPARGEVPAPEAEADTAFGVNAAVGYRFRFGRFAAAPRIGWSYVFPLDMSAETFPFKGVNVSGDIALSFFF